MGIDRSNPAAGGGEANRSEPSLLRISRGAHPPQPLAGAETVDTRRVDEDTETAGTEGSFAMGGTMPR